MSSIPFSQLQKMAEESGIGQPIPAGRYTVKAVEATAEKTKAGDKDKITVKFSVLDGPHANRKVFNQYVISPDNPNAIAFFFKHMAAFGLTGDFFASEPSMSQVAGAIKDKVVDVDVIIDNYGGEDRNKVKNTYPSSTSPASAVSAPSSDPFRVSQQPVIPADPPADVPF